MLRLILVLGVGVVLSQIKPAVDKVLVAKSITGTESLVQQSGLVEIKGSVLEVRLQELGGSLITIATEDGQQPKLFIPIGADINLPKFGEYVSATGKMLGKSIISCEAVKSLRMPLLEYPEVSTASVVNNRVSVPVRGVLRYDRRSDKGYHYVVFETETGEKQTGLVSELVGKKEVESSTKLHGYLLPSGLFFIERCS